MFVVLLGAAVMSCTDAPPGPRRESLDRDARERSIRQALQQRPQRIADATFLDELGRALWTQGRLSEAESVYGDLLQVRDSVSDTSALVQIQLLRGHYKAAAATARTSVAKHGRAAQPAWLLELWPQLQWFDSRTALPAEPLDFAMKLVSGLAFERGVASGVQDATPARKVSLSPYWIGVHEVTTTQFLRFIEDSGYAYRLQPAPPNNSEEGAQAIVGVSWNDARAFTMWLSARSGEVYRMPTEAEWEFAARGPEGFREPWGHQPGQAQTTGNWGLTSPDALRSARPPVRAVGSFARDLSPFGLYDMAGNAAEWCIDEYDETYYAWSPDVNPFGPVETRGLKVLRGGSWNSPWTEGFAIRRGNAGANQPYTGFGFRVVREPGIGAAAAGSE
jgi:formylglycine-generating enzyme